MAAKARHQRHAKHNVHHERQGIGQCADMLVSEHVEQSFDRADRRAHDHRFVSILVLAQGETLLGRRHFWPVYAAAEKHKLPLLSMFSAY